MDKIHIKGLEIYAYHGVNQEEKDQGQPFVMDITLTADLSAARNSDDLNDTINYAAVRKTIQRVFTQRKYDLIERAAQAVCDGVLGEFSKVREINILLKKPQAPMNAKFEYVAVELCCSRFEKRGEMECKPC